MYSELVDQLRCLNVHAESWLVAAADTTEDRHVMRGVLGCPECRAQYPIEDGIADFTGGGRLPLALEPPTGPAAADDALVIKLAAMLDLAEPGGYVVLCGGWGRLAHPLRRLVDVQIVVVNGPPDVTMGGGVSGIVTADRIPLAGGSARGVAVDAGFGLADEASRAAFLRSAVAATQPNGRVVGPASAAPPDGVEAMAADELHWVGTRIGGQPMLKLVRAPR